MPVGDLVVFGDFNAEVVVLRHKGSQSCQTLAATTSNTHQQGIAHGRFQDTNLGRSWESQSNIEGLSG